MGYRAKEGEDSQFSEDLDMEEWYEYAQHSLIDQMRSKERKVLLSIGGRIGR